jgi:hypothetical protein
MVPYVRPWFDAWVESAYGAAGFWSRHLPSEHFATAAATAPQLAALVADLLRRHPAVTQVIDLGAGDGAMLTGLDRFDLELVGVDLRPRPDGLDPRIRWVQDLWDVRLTDWTTGGATPLLAHGGPVLVVANEWLDDLPCPVVTRHPDGWRELVVDDEGSEQPGPRLNHAALDWADRWWPHGGRAEIGLTRDAAWRRVVGSVVARGGVALMIDYGHRLPDRPRTGTFTAYRDGRLVVPAPNGETNLTAHVAIDAVQAAGEEVGALTAWCGRQRDLPTPPRLPPETADPLLDLVRRSQEAAWTGTWGDHWWLVQYAPTL